MAVLTSVANGNKSLGATWNTGTAPVDGDTCIISHNVIWDTSSAIGTAGATGTEAIRINAGASLTVASGVTLSLKGDINVYRGGRYIQIGSLDVVVGTGVIYYLKGMDSPWSPSTNIASIEFAGVSKANRASVTRTGAGVFRLSSNGSVGAYTSLSLVNVVFRGLGSTTSTSFTHSIAQTNAHSYIRSAAFIGCGQLYVSTIGATNNLDWDDVAIINPLRNAAGSIGMNPSLFLSSSIEKTTGIRKLSNYYYYGDYTEAWLFVNSLEYTDFYITNHKIDTVSSTPLCSSQHVGKRIFTIVDQDWVSFINPQKNPTLIGTAGNANNKYEDVISFARCGNQHHFDVKVGSLGLATTTASRFLFDGDGYFEYDTGDCFIPTSSVIADTVLCINKAGCPASLHTATSSISFNKLTSDNNYHIAVGETVGASTQLVKLKNSLFTNQNKGIQQNSAFQSLDSPSIDYNGYYNMTDTTNQTHPIKGTRSYVGNTTVASWFVGGTFDGTAGRGLNDVNADPQYIDNTRTVRKWFGYVLGVDTSNTTTWTPKLLGAELLKGSGFDKDGNVATPVAGLTIASCLDWVYQGYSPQNVAYKGTGEALADIGAVAVTSVAPSVNNVWIDDLTTKYRQGGEDGISGLANLTIHGIKNSFESFQVLLYSEAGLSNVDVTISAINGPSGSTITDVTKYLQWYHDCTTNVSRIEYEYGMYPDALIPDTDRYYKEKRNVFPFTVAAGKVQGVVFDLGTVTGQQVGTYTAVITVKSGATTIGTCNLSFVVHDIELPSTSSFPVDTASFSPHLGYGFSWLNNDAYCTDLMTSYVKAAIYHRIGINFINWNSDLIGNQGWSWDNTTNQLSVNSWLPQDSWMIPIANGSLISSGTYAGGKLSAYRSYKSWPADHISSTVPMEYRSLATRQYLSQMWEHLVSIGAEPDKYLFVDRFYDEPSASELTPNLFRGTTKATSFTANMLTVQDAATLNNNNYRNTFVTSSRQTGFDTFDDYGFYARWINAPACPTYTHTCQWGENATLQTRDKDRSDRHYWLYIGCGTSACGMVGDSRFSGQVDLCVDADAMYNIFHGPIWYLYQATGSLHWNLTSYIDSNYAPYKSTWRNYWDGYNHGDGFFLYAGVANGTGRTLLANTPVIGGTHDIPIESLRLKTVWRDSIVFWELCKMAEAKHGRNAVLTAINSLFAPVPLEQKYWNLNTDPDYYRSARLAVITLVEGVSTIPVLGTPTASNIAQTTVTANIPVTSAGGSLATIVSTLPTPPTVTQIRAGKDSSGNTPPYYNLTASPSAGTTILSVTGLTQNTSYYIHSQQNDAEGDPSSVVTSSVFKTLVATVSPVIESVTFDTSAATSAMCRVVTNKIGGSVFYKVGTVAPTLAETKSGSSVSVATTSTSFVALSSLSPGTVYYVGCIYIDADGAESTLSSTSFTAPNKKGVRVTMYQGSIPSTSLTDLHAIWWDTPTPVGNPIYSVVTESTDGSGVFDLDLNGITQLNVGSPGFLLLYKLNTTDYKSSLVFAGRLDVGSI